MHFRFARCPALRTRSKIEKPEVDRTLDLEDLVLPEKNPGDVGLDEFRFFGGITLVRGARTQNVPQRRDWSGRRTRDIHGCDLSGFDGLSRFESMSRAAPGSESTADGCVHPANTVGCPFLERGSVGGIDRDKRDPSSRLHIRLHGSA